MNATLFTSETRYRDVFEQAARDRGTALVTVGELAAESVSDADLAGFSYLEHRQNVALALEVCATLGVERRVALRGMWEARPDPGALTVHEVEFFGRRLWFANGFAANDPESSERIWRMVLERVPEVERRLAIFNCRLDRPDRSRQLGEACVDWPPADRYLLMGSGTYIFARAATRRGLDPTRVLVAEDRRADDVFETILEQSGRSAIVMGLGNVHGGGEELARLFRNRGIQRKLA